MPTSKRRKHGSGKRPPRRISKLELRDALAAKLDRGELDEIAREVNALVERERAAATEEAYRRQFAVMMRVLRDRFGFGRDRLHRLWDACLEYIHDIDEGHMSTQEMLDCLEHEDGIRITWRVRVEE